MLSTGSFGPLKLLGFAPIQTWRQRQKILANIPAALAPRSRTANTAALFVRVRPVTLPLSANAGTPLASQRRLPEALPECRRLPIEHGNAHEPLASPHRNIPVKPPCLPNSCSQPLL